MHQSRRLITTLAHIAALAAALGCSAPGASDAGTARAPQSQTRRAEPHVASDPCAVAQTCTGWTIALIMSTPSELTAARDQLLTRLTNTESQSVRVVALIADAAGSRLISIAHGRMTHIADFDADAPTSPKTLHALGRHLAQREPSPRTAVIFWGHGKGWRGVGAQGRARATQPSWSLADGELERALTALTAGLGRKLDLLGFDACLMGSWEVATTATPFTRVLVAAPDLVPSAGWPLDRALARVDARADVTAAELAAEIAEQFRQASRHHSLLTTLDAAGIATLDRSLDELARTSLDADCKLQRAWLTDTFRYRESGALDLEGVAAAIEQHGCSESVRARATQVRGPWLRADWTKPARVNIVAPAGSRSTCRKIGWTSATSARTPRGIATRAGPSG